MSASAEDTSGCEKHSGNYKDQSGDESEVPNRTNTRKSNGFVTNYALEQNLRLFRQRTLGMKEPPVFLWNDTKNIHRVIHDKTKFMWEEGQDMLPEQKKEYVMHVIHPFLTRCGSVALCMVNETDASLGIFLGSSLPTDKLCRTPYLGNARTNLITSAPSHPSVVTLEKDSRMFLESTVNYCMKLRESDNIDRWHQGNRQRTNADKTRAGVARNKQLYCEGYGCPVFIHYPESEEALQKVQKSGGLYVFANKFASSFKNILYKKDDRIKRVYVADTPIDCIFLGDIITADDVLAIASDMYGVETWAELMANDDLMKAYFGTGQLRHEVEEKKGSDNSQQMIAKPKPEGFGPCANTKLWLEKRRKQNYM